MNYSTQSIEQGSNLVFKEIFPSLNLDNLFIKNTNAAIKSDVERAMGTNPTANTEVMIFLGNLKNELSFLNTQSTNPIAEMGKGFVVKPGDFEKEFPTPKTSQDYS